MLAFNGSALFNIRRKALGHLIKFIQRSIPYRFGLGLSTAFYRLGLSTVSKQVRFFFGGGGGDGGGGWGDAVFTEIISSPSNKSSGV